MRPGLASLLCAPATAAVLVGCAASAPAPPAASSSANGADSGSSRQSAPGTDALRAAAGLAPCPESTGAAAVGGLPDLRLRCLGDGPAVRLAALRGAPTVVSLWAGWCPPCRKELPALQRLADGGRVRVLGVLTRDTVRDGLAAAKGLGVRFPSVVDEDGVLLARLGMAGLPVTVLVRPDGVVAGRHVGPALSDAEVRGLVRRYLGVHA